MARYHVDNRIAGVQQNITTTFKTSLTLFSATGATCRGRAVSLSVGADGAPNATDCQIVYAVMRQTTTSGTRSAETPLPLDPADVASRTGSGANYTAEPTYAATSALWSRALNQRASMQWVAPDQDAGLRWPSTSDNGLAFVALSPTYASPVHISAEFEE